VELYQPMPLARICSGSAADNNAIANLWSVVITRPLGLTNDDDKTIKEGGVYNVGFISRQSSFLEQHVRFSWLSVRLHCNYRKTRGAP
jgi:hypothetical protein